MLATAPGDHALEAWLEDHAGELADIDTERLPDFLMWLPLIGVPANDDTVVSSFKKTRLRLI